MSARTTLIPALIVSGAVFLAWPSTRPTVSADRKFVLLNVSAGVSELDKAATTKTTVTTVVTHSTPDVKPVAESHVIEQPKVVLERTSVRPSVENPVPPPFRVTVGIPQPPG